MLNVDSNDEIWVPIEEFENRYEVSDLGNIRSIQDNHGNYRVKKITGYIRSDTCEYLYVQLWRKDIPVTRAIHRLVAKAFVKNPLEKPLVNHLDGIKLNNAASNVEWCTHSENHKHAYSMGLRQAPMAQLGKKAGNTSTYNNVTWDPTRNKWKGTMKHKGKMYFQRRFDTEREAAEHVNWIIDYLGLTDRPKNIIN